MWGGAAVRNDGGGGAVGGVAEAGESSALAFVKGKKITINCFAIITH